MNFVCPFQSIQPGVSTNTQGEVRKETSNVSPKCLLFGIEKKKKEVQCILILENKLKNGLVQFQAQLKFSIKQKKEKEKKGLV
jgi:hypothetical protein